MSGWAITNAVPGWFGTGTATTRYCSLRDMSVSPTVRADFGDAPVATAISGAPIAGVPTASCGSKTTLSGVMTASRTSAAPSIVDGRPRKSRGSARPPGSAAAAWARSVRVVSTCR